ncbi:MAG: CDP-glycerol glycerophosphotransferase family protein [Candidatus Tectimicrobiota bacterium]
MNIQDYVLAVPYQIAWHLYRRVRRHPKVIFYCEDPLDYIMFAPIQKHLPPLPIVVTNRKTARYLKSQGVPYGWMPSFPQAVIMGRHKPYKFPVAQIIKIGFDHGLYQFKKWTSAKYYNGFRCYFVSSESQVALGRERGITSTRAVGYPKIDPLFDGTYDAGFQERLRRRLGLDPQKKTLLFSSTWDVDGMSALERWIDKVHVLTRDYNVLVTVHTWTSRKNVEKLQQLPGVIYIADPNVVPYLLLADVLVGDTSSLIGEFCALDKPIITFRVPAGPRSVKEIMEMLADISLQIDDFEEIHSAIRTCLANPSAQAPQRHKATALMFTALDGQAGARAARHIRAELQGLFE